MTYDREHGINESRSLIDTAADEHFKPFLSISFHAVIKASKIGVGYLAKPTVHKTMELMGLEIR